MFCNTSYEELHIAGQFENHELIQVFGVDGSLLMEEALRNNFETLNINTLLPGIYIVKIGNNTERFIKQ